MPRMRHPLGRASLTAREGASLARTIHKTADPTSTTRQGITMITKVERFVTPDLHAPNLSLNLDATHLHNDPRTRPPLAAVTYTAIKRSPADDLSMLTDACRQGVEDVIYDHGQRRVLMFVADGPWQPKS